MTRVGDLYYHENTLRHTRENGYPRPRSLDSHFRGSDDGEAIHNYREKRAPLVHLTSQESALIKAGRVARMATADAQGAPHLIPVCFAYDGSYFYSVLDRKPKRAALTRLKRVRNILSNPNVALVLDHFEEDWSKLWYVLVTGTAQLVHAGEEHRRAIAVLREKYPQYRDMDIDENPVIRITPTRVTSWGALPQG